MAGGQAYFTLNAENQLLEGAVLANRISQVTLNLGDGAVDIESRVPGRRYKDKISGECCRFWLYWAKQGMSQRKAAANG